MSSTGTDEGLRTSLKVSAVGLIGRALKAITLVIMARALGTADFGRFASAYAIVMFLAFIPMVGLDQSILRSVVPGASGRDAIKTRMRSTFRFVTGTSVVGALALIVAAPWIASAADLTDFETGFRLMALAIVPYNLLVLAIAFLLALREPIRGSVAQDVVAPVVTLAVVVGLIAAGTDWTPMGVAYVAGFVLAVAWVAARLRKLGASAPVPAEEIEIPLLRGLIGFGAPVMAIGVFAFGSFSLDVPVVAAATTASDAGVYGGAARLATYATILQFGLVATFVPRIAELGAAGRLSDVAALIREGTGTLTRFVAPFAGAGLALTPELLKLLGGGFTRGDRILAILLIGQTMATILLLGGYALVMLGKQKLDLVNHIVLFVVIMGGGYLAARTFGPIGMAVTVAGAMVAVNLVKFLQLSRTVAETVSPWAKPARLIPIAAGAVVTLVGAPLAVRIAVAVACLAAAVNPTRELIGGANT